MFYVIIYKSTIQHNTIISNPDKFMFKNYKNNNIPYIRPRVPEKFLAKEAIALFNQI